MYQKRALLANLLMDMEVFEDRSLVRLLPMIHARPFRVAVRSFVVAVNAAANFFS